MNAANLFCAFLHESGDDAMNFRGVSIYHLVFVENAIMHNIFIYDIDIGEGELVGELARGVELFEKNINLLRNNNQILLPLLRYIYKSIGKFQPSCKTL